MVWLYIYVRERFAIFEQSDSYSGAGPCMCISDNLIRTCCVCISEVAGRPVVVGIVNAVGRGRERCQKAGREEKRETSKGRAGIVDPF